MCRSLLEEQQFLFGVAQRFTGVLGEVPLFSSWEGGGGGEGTLYMNKSSGQWSKG